jgi:hypothetical protein
VAHYSASTVNKTEKAITLPSLAALERVSPVEELLSAW